MQSYQGGCGGLCGSLLEPAECATALARGAAIGYSDLGHESTALNDDLKNVQLYSKMIRMLSIKDQMHSCGPNLLMLPAALFLDLILFLRITDETMELFSLCVVTSQSSSYYYYPHVTEYYNYSDIQS